VVTAAFARADDAKTRAAAASVVEKYGDAVVTVQLVVKNRFVFQGQEHRSQESKLEIAGTVVAPNGLTVASDFTSNPAALMSSSEDGPKVETETTDVKLLLRDGRELPARFVLRDQDLDLAFVMPEEKGLTLPHVSFEPGPPPAVLDELLFLSQLGRSLSREVSVSLGRVRAVVKKPRTFVVSDLLNGILNLGCPVFDLSGRAVGLVVLRRAPAAAVSQGGFRDMLEIMNPVILTAQDVTRVAAQAVKPEAKNSPARR
jgi:S1-C subfamily serine protease